MTNLVLRESSSVLRPGDYSSSVAEATLFVNSKQNIDVWMDEFVTAELKASYTNIFIPVSFGDNLSDFLGLRLALHIRTTKGPNQESNLFLYGPETSDEISAFCNLAQILNTKGVKLIEYNLHEISLHMKENKVLLTHYELVKELRKLNVEVPSNYYDSHSISNVWGLYRLCEVAGIDIDTVSTLKDQKDKLSHVYFKWLTTVNEVKNIRSEEVVKAEKNYADKLKGLTVLGKIELPPIKKMR